MPQTIIVPLFLTNTVMYSEILSLPTVLAVDRILGFYKMSQLL